MTGDAKVSALLRAGISHEAFALLIGVNDPYVLIDGEIIALTEPEFYAMHAVFNDGTLTEETFKTFLETEDLSFMQPADIEEVRRIKEALPNCSACRYKKFKETVNLLIKKYNMDIGKNPNCIKCELKYPECEEPVVSHIHEHIDDLYGVSYSQRKPCIDCVEKHVSQAYVLTAEAHSGYGEYAGLVYAHLSEAVTELPPYMEHLRELLEFCMAKTGNTGKPFLPIGSMMTMIKMYRLAAADGKPEDEPKPENPYMELELTDEMLEELGILKLSQELSDKLKGRLEAADMICVDGNPSEEEVRLSWEGEMACASECIAQIAPKLAGLIRNRRLVFVSNPWLADRAGLSNRDILAHL